MLEGTVAFTGRLASMKRAEAFALVRKHGGKPREGVTRKTNVLVVGELGWPLLDDGRPSNSLAQARSHGITVASERRFLEWLGQSAPDAQSKTYTADQLASLSKLPNEVVDQLAMFGLIEVRGASTASATSRRRGRLRACSPPGPPCPPLPGASNEIRKWLPDARLSNLKLFPESSDRLLVEQLKGRTDKTGQFVLDVESPATTPMPFSSPPRPPKKKATSPPPSASTAGSMNMDTADPAAPFNLGNVLRASGRNLRRRPLIAPPSRPRPDSRSAWYNLADMLDDQRRTKEAIDCLKRALDADPSYLDAMFNMGLFLQRLERHAEAAQWWRRYLAVDRSSPWAARAKRALKYCEIQLQGSTR